MPPVVIDVINDFRAGLLRAEQTQMAEAARRWLGVEQALQAQADALSQWMAGDGHVTRVEHLMQSRRWQELQRQVDVEMRKYSTYLDGRIVDGQRNMALNAISHSQATINAISTEAQIVVPFNRLPTSAVENMIGLAGDGSPVRALLDEAAAAGPDAMAQELVNGIALGRNPLEVARRAIRQGLGQSFTRMATIARTEQLRVYRETTLQSYRAGGVVVGYRRLSARDRRVCPGCLMADGRFYPLDHTFDQHPNCVVGGTVINSPTVLATSKRWFDGQVIEIRTINGHILTVTPNHPVLTDKGWIAAHLLHEGDNVISSLNGQRTILSVDPYSNGKPTIIEDVIESFSRSSSMISVSMPTSAKDFHGDGGYGNVNIVRANSLLQDRRQTAFGQPISEQSFSDSGMRSRSFFANGAFRQIVISALFTSYSIMGSDGISGFLFRGSSRLQQPIGFGLIADSNIVFDQTAPDYGAASAVLRSNSVFGLAGNIEGDQFVNRQRYALAWTGDIAAFQIAEQSGIGDTIFSQDGIDIDAIDIIPDCIVKLTSRQFSGHVYNLQTSTGWYIAEGIITHNCRCAAVPVLRDVPRTEYETGQQWFRRQPENTQRAILGRGRFEAWATGRATLDDMVAVRTDDTWGDAIVPVRVSDL
jgi:SPP1 gp7 family putative phage head morphogenesis protein